MSPSVIIPRMSPWVIIPVSMTVPFRRSRPRSSGWTFVIISVTRSVGTSVYRTPSARSFFPSENEFSNMKSNLKISFHFLFFSLFSYLRCVLGLRSRVDFLRSESRPECLFDIHLKNALEHVQRDLTIFCLGGFFSLKHFWIKMGTLNVKNLQKNTFAISLQIILSEKKAVNKNMRWKSSHS